jgi:hypothetical protein
MNKTAKLERAVLVTTAHRGVFFGYATDVDGEIVVLRQARNCLYWPAANHGFLGLTTMGPVEGARVGPPAPELRLRDVTSVALCSSQAVKAWEAMTWVV